MATITNVIKWVTNQEEFRQQIASGVDQVVAMEKAVERTTRSLSGEGLIRAAHNAAAAVEQLGNTTKLTAAEKDRMNRLVEKAIEKYQALGQTAPSALHALAEATRATQGPMEKVSEHTASVQRHFDSFSGDKIIQEAHAIATAVEQVGGASTLTAAEQAKVNTVVQDALAKYQQLGQQAPAALHALAEATTPISREMSSLNDHVTRVTALTRRFAGDDVIRNAHEYAKAVEQVGGASKLTATEQTEVNKIVQEAIAKYRALGETAPAALLELEQATRQLQPATEGWFASFAKMTASFVTAQAIWDLAKMGLTAVVDTVKAAGRAVADMVTNAAALGDELLALSAKTGITVEALSELRFIASQGNTDLNAITNSIFKMQVQLAEGSKDTRQALKLLHLDINALRQQRPDEAYLSILAALREVPTHADRAALGMRLFGKGFKETAQLAQEDIAGLIAEARRLGLVMTTEAAVAGDRYGDMLDKASKKAESLRMALGFMLLPVLIAVGETLVDGFVAALSKSGTSAADLQRKIDELAVRTVKAFAVIMEWGAQLANLLIKVFAANYIGPFLLQIGTLAGLLQDMLVPLAMMPGAVGDAAKAAMVQLEKVQQTAATGLVLTANAVDGVDAAAKAAVSAAQHLGREFEQTYARVKAEIVDAARKARESNGALGESFGSLKAGEAVTDALIKKMAELATKIQLAERAGSSIADIVAVYGKEAAAVAVEVTALGLVTEASVARIAAAWRSAQLAELLKAVSLAAAKAVQEMSAASEKAGKAGIAAQAADLITQGEAIKRFEEEARQRTLSGSALKLRQIDVEHAAYIADLNKKHGADTAYYQRAKALADAHFQHLRDIATGTAGTLIERARAAGFATRGDLAETAKKARDLYNDMRASGGTFYDWQIAAAKKAADEADAANSRTGVSWAKRLETMKAQFQDATAQLGADIAGLLADNIRSGDWSQFENQMKEVLAQFMGSAMAAAIDFLVPGLGTMLKPLLTAISDKILGALGLGTKGRDLVKEFAASLGGFDALQVKLQALGAEGGRLWIQLTQGVGRNNPAQAQAAIDAITAAFARADEATRKYGVTWAQLGVEQRIRAAADAATALQQDFQTLTRTLGVSGADAVRLMSKEINTFIGNALRAGVQIPAGMRPIIEQLIRMGLLTEENRRLMLGLADSTMPALADIEAAAARYGLTLDQLGPKVAQLKIDETAQQIVDDFNLLILAGADVATVLGAQAEKIQGLVTQALRFGLELPASMRPLLEQMVTLGLLTDENGELLKDLAWIKFAEPLEASVDRLILKLDELIAALVGGVGGALDDLGRRRVHIPVSFEVEDIPDVGARTAPTAATGGLVTSATILPFARGGAVPRLPRYFTDGGTAGELVHFKPIGTDTQPAMLTPGEIVLNAAQQRNVANGLSGGVSSEDLAEAIAAALVRAGIGAGGPAVLVAPAGQNKEALIDWIIQQLPRRVRRNDADLRSKLRDALGISEAA